MTTTQREETFTEIYCRLFRAYRSAMWSGYVPTTSERATIRYMRARVARRPVHSPKTSIPARVHMAAARAGVSAELRPEGQLSLEFV